MSKAAKRKFVTAAQFMRRFSPEDQARIAARTAELIAEEQTLQELRRASDLTQAQIATILGIGQEHVSRLEQRSDMLLSTLASYVRAMGGELKLVVAFPDRKPVALASLADAFNPSPVKPARRSKRRRRSDVAPV